MIGIGMPVKDRGMPADIASSRVSEQVVKIDNHLKNVAPPRGRESGRVPTRETTAVPLIVTVGDDVHLTATAERLRDLERDLSAIEITDTARIAAVRQAIAEGRFVVDEEAVADGLIDESIDLIQRQTESP